MLQMLPLEKDINGLVTLPMACKPEIYSFLPNKLKKKKFLPLINDRVPKSKSLNTRQLLRRYTIHSVANLKLLATIFFSWQAQLQLYENVRENDIYVKIKIFLQESWKMIQDFFLMGRYAFIFKYAYRTQFIALLDALWNYGIFPAIIYDTKLCTVDAVYNYKYKENINFDKCYISLELFLIDAYLKEENYVGVFLTSKQGFNIINNKLRNRFSKITNIRYFYRQIVEQKDWNYYDEKLNGIFLKERERFELFSFFDRNYGACDKLASVIWSSCFNLVASHVMNVAMMALLLQQLGFCFEYGEMQIPFLPVFFAHRFLQRGAVLCSVKFICPPQQINVCKKINNRSRLKIQKLASDLLWLDELDREEREF